MMSAIRDERTRTENEVALLVPRLDCEVALIAGARERFIERGSFPLVSGPGVIALCEDKLETNRFLADCGLGCRERGCHSPRPTWRSIAVQSRPPLW
jgi:hypothetical protein